MIGFGEIAKLVGKGEIGKAILHGGTEAIKSITKQLLPSSSQTTSGSANIPDIDTPEEIENEYKNQATKASSLDPSQPNISEPKFDQVEAPSVRISADDLVGSLKTLHTNIINYLQTINKNNMAGFDYVKSKLSAQDATFVSIRKTTSDLTRSISGIEARLGKVESKFDDLKNSQDKKKSENLIPDTDATPTSKPEATSNKSSLLGDLTEGGLITGALALAPEIAEVVGAAAIGFIYKYWDDPRVKPLREKLTTLAEDAAKDAAEFLWTKLKEDMKKEWSEFSWRNPFTDPNTIVGSGPKSPLNNPSRYGLPGGMFEDNPTTRQQLHDERLKKREEKEKNQPGVIDTIKKWWRGSDDSQQTPSTGGRAGGTLIPGLALMSKMFGSGNDGGSDKQTDKQNFNLADIQGLYGPKQGGVVPQNSEIDSTYGPPDLAPNQVESPSDLIQQMSMITGGRAQGGSSGGLQDLRGGNLRGDSPTNQYRGGGGGSGGGGASGRWTPGSDTPPGVNNYDNNGKTIPADVLAKAASLADQGPAAMFAFMRSQNIPVDSAWCGDFVAAVVKAGGGTPVKGYSIANSWLNYGTAVKPGEEQPGDIAILSRGLAPGQMGGHVGIVGPGGYDPKTGKFNFVAGNRPENDMISQRGMQFRRPLQPQSSPTPGGQNIPGNISGSLSKEQYEKMFTGTPLSGQYDHVVAQAKANGISPVLLASIMAQESGRGRYTSGNNPGGIMDPATGSSRKKQYGSIEEGISETARIVAKNYTKGGGTLKGLHDIYSPEGAANDPGGLNKDWLPGVQKFMGQLAAPEPQQQTPATTSTQLPDINVTTTPTAKPSGYKMLPNDSYSQMMEPDGTLKHYPWLIKTNEKGLAFYNALSPENKKAFDSGKLDLSKISPEEYSRLKKLDPNIDKSFKANQAAIGNVVSPFLNAIRSMSGPTKDNSGTAISGPDFTAQANKQITQGTGPFTLSGPGGIYEQKPSGEGDRTPRSQYETAADWLNQGGSGQKVATLQTASPQKHLDMLGGEEGAPTVPFTGGGKTGVAPPQDRGDSPVERARTNDRQRMIDGKTINKDPQAITNPKHVDTTGPNAGQPPEQQPSGPGDRGAGNVKDADWLCGICGV